MSGSTGFRSQHGATWHEELIITMNSGFGPGAPRNETCRPVKEWREKGAFLPRLRGIRGIGKAPAQVLAMMVQA